MLPSPSAGDQLPPTSPGFPLTTPWFSVLTKYVWSIPTTRRRHGSSGWRKKRASTSTTFCSMACASPSARQGLGRLWSGSMSQWTRGALIFCRSSLANPEFPPWSAKVRAASCTSRSWVSVLDGFLPLSVATPLSTLSSFSKHFTRSPRQKAFLSNFPWINALASSKFVSCSS